MRRLGKQIRGIWAIALQPLLISICIRAIALPSWSQLDQAEPPVDYSPQAISEIFIIHSIVLLAPIGIVLWLRRLALQSPSRDATATWFSYISSLNWVIWGMWGLWIWATLALNTSNFVDIVMGGNVSLLSQWTIKFCLFMLPPAVVVVACNGL